ncbi:MAG: YibE/F family protein [Defluviitaleaceae bacterium]|nr:YibE/F family protein [Defluviitaleaceae bacterium]MCL2275567.1 YibE/F family protein [Defluviitaleaceae bacterium]
MTNRLLDKQVIFFAVVTCAMVGMVLFGLHRNEGARGEYFIPARVVDVVEDMTSLNEAGARVGTQIVNVRLLSGPRRGDIVEAANRLFPIEHAAYAQVGQRLLVFYSDGFAHVQSYDRSFAIYGVVLGFFVLLGLVFGKAGIKSAFGLVFTFVVIIFLLLPLIISGAPPALVTVGLSLCIIAVSLISIMGFGEKTWVSIAGSALGIVFYSLFYLLISALLRITGFNVQEVDLLILAGLGTGVSELLFCAILIASLGALMDVAVSLASVTAELSGKTVEFKPLFGSAMKVGRDIIGSSSNTLILAFTGSFFVMLILFNVHNTQYAVLINRTDIAIEVLRAVSATAAMVLCAPATAFIGAHVFTAKNTSKKRG